MCTRNGEPHVREQILSILAQVPPPREVVVGDDASTDGTLAVIREAVARHRTAHPESLTAVRLIERDAPLGVVRNFESTIRECAGSLIALSDQDDVWPVGRLARLIPVFDDPAVSLVHTDARLIDAGGHDTGARLLDVLEAAPEERLALVRGDAFRVLLRRNLVTGATVLLRRELAEASMPFPESWVHDEWLAMMSAVEQGLRLVPEPWLDYRQHAGNEIGASKVTWARRWERLREPRDERAPRLIARAAALVEHLERASIDEEILADARGKLEHESDRGRLPRARALRIPGVIGGALRGRYDRYSRGAVDVVRDLVQPATRSAS